MKVALSTRAVFPFHGYGGMEKYVYYLGKHLALQGVNVEIVTSSPDRIEDKSYYGIRYLFIPIKLETYHPLTFALKYHIFNLGIAKHLSKNKPDVLHSFGITSFAYLFLKRRSPTVIQAFGNEPCKSRGLVAKTMVFPIALPLKRCMTHAELIASEGESQTKEIVSLFSVSKEKIFYLPDGVEISTIEECISHSKISRENIGLNESDFVLITVNRLVPHKGIPYLIKALELVKREIDDVKLIMIGKGPEEAEIKDLIKQYRLKNIVFQFKDVKESMLFNYYGLADIFITPTLYEGLPLVVLEAMASGLPVIATNAAENPQVVKHGKNGFLVPVANSKAIGDAVLEIYDRNLMKKMGRYSKEIIKDYDWRIIAKKAIKEYEKLIANSS